jgi:hypothetical protein
MDAVLPHTKASSRLEPLFLFLFFFNTFLLPQGLSWSLLLTPVWLYLLHITGRLYLLRGLLLIFICFGCVHLLLGVDLVYYAVSVALMLGLGIFLITAWYYLNNSDIDYEQLFKRIVLLNFIFTLISIPFLFIPFLKPLVWYVMSMSEGIGLIPRLKMFTYEASHYSYLLAPVAIFCYAKALFTHTRNPLPALFMVTLPLLLSLSFGVLAVLGFTGLAILALYFNSVFDTSRKRLLLVAGLIFLLAVFFVLYRYYPSNILFVRIRNIINGQDTSARGRTREAFILAHRIIAQKSYWWGIGPGQLKVLGRTMVIQYYSYSNIPSVVRIPNACAETILCFGYIGFVFRIGVQLFLFFKTRVSGSPYRLWLFLFLFLFQFMGSYITNAAEYIFWMIAFMPVIDKFFAGNSPKMANIAS